MSYSALFALVYVFAPNVILRPYGLQDHPQLHDLVVVLLRFVAVYSLFDVPVGRRRLIDRDRPIAPVLSGLMA